MRAYERGIRRSLPEEVTFQLLSKGRFKLAKGDGVREMKGMGKVKESLHGWSSVPTGKIARGEAVEPCCSREGF